MNPQWKAFINISKMLDSNISINEKIHKIIKTVIRSIPQADAGFLLLWKEDLQCLTIDATVNFKLKYYKDSKILPSEGISGKVFKSGKSMLLNGEQQINDAMDNMRVKNKNYYFNSFVHCGVPKSCISVPIEYNHQRFGVLTVDNFLNKDNFNEDNLQFLQAIATQIAIAIKLSTNLQEIQNQSQELELALDNHHTLNKMILDGKNISQLLRSLSDITRDEFFFFNSIGNFEFSTKNTTPIYNNISSILSDEIFSLRKYDSYISVPITNTDEFAHIFIISSSTHINGFLITFSKSANLSPMKKMILIHATSLISIEQMKKQSSLEKTIQKRQDLIRLIKNNDHSLELVEISKTYFSNSPIFSILLIDHSYLNSADFTSILSFEDSINKQLDFAKIILIQKNKFVYCIIQTKPNTTNTVISLIKESLPNVSLYTGREVNEILELYISYSDLTFLTIINDAQDDKIYYTYKDLGIFRYLLLLSDQEKKSYIREELDLLLTEKNSRELLDTLFTYFKFKKNVSLTAEKMHLHVNSIYYRLSQIEEKLQISLSDFQSNINLYSALFLEKFLFEKMKNKKST